MFQTKQDKISEKDLNEMKISNLPDKELEVMIIKWLIKFRRKMNKHSDIFNKDQNYKNDSK